MNQDLSTEHDYDSPTNCHFDLGWQNVICATLQRTADASGSDARAEIRRVDQAGNTLATGQSSQLFPTAQTRYAWPLDPVCFATHNVTIQLERQARTARGPIGSHSMSKFPGHPS
ncbi:MAG: hypothetical protein CL908_19685 [Deltaproteobacteria bacterium]|jgi:hypothetical protein|nr:hypothetical protein [Deltaproteobacteria bacterium]